MAQELSSSFERNDGTACGEMDIAFPDKVWVDY